MGSSIRAATIGLMTMFLLPVHAWGQSEGPDLKLESPSATPVQRPVPVIPSAPNPATARARIARWFELQNMTLNLRYRFIDTSAGAVTTNQVQHRETIRGRVKFDRSGRYAWNFGVFTGTRFTSGWDNTSWGIAGAQKNFAFKTSYFSAIPVAGVEAQYGGLYILRGESTEVTTYDDDGYIIGQRLSVKRPKQFYFDEISATVAYLSPDPREVPVSKRTKYLNDTPNYRHLLFGKRIGTRAGVSTDLTYAGGARTWRQGMNLRTPELRVLDAVTLEAYQRVNRTPEHGFAVTLEKALPGNVRANWGYASIDPQYGILNSDRFQIGNRVFAMVIYNISQEFLASAFITREVGNEVPLPQRTLLNIVLSYNALPALRRTGLFQ
jgi:hypothetical protein